MQKGINWHPNQNLFFMLIIRTRNQKALNKLEFLFESNLKLVLFVRL